MIFAASTKRRRLGYGWLTPLAARMMGAWWFGAGLILVHALIEDDRHCVRNG